LSVIRKRSFLDLCRYQQHHRAGGAVIRPIIRTSRIVAREAGAQTSTHRRSSPAQMP